MTICLTTRSNRGFPSLLAGICLFVAASAWAADGLQSFTKEALTIETASGRHVFTVERAISPEQYAQGLMYRKTLAKDAGMLFNRGVDSPMKMWMKNTLVSLDMLFIDGAGKIVYIAPNTVPESTTVITAGKPVRAVLELAAGVTAEKHIQVGDKVIHDSFTR
jgi:uncharacterized membrane protein (UPF0127 family)